ncbi:DUF86 domain-containing protein [Candidatus Magnetomoraceae bacterium gMMP-15]
MIDKYLIEKKLTRIKEFLRELETAKGPENFNSFSKDVIFKRFVERNIELSIEQMIDVCKHFISGLDLQEPESYAKCFEILGQSNIIAKETVNVFKSMAKYRNLIIHSYDGVDDTITFGIYKKRLSDFRLFISSVRQYLRSLSSKNNEKNL